MKDKDFEELKNILEDELNFDPTSYASMREKISKVPNLLQKFISIYITEKEILNEFENKLKELYKNLYHKYKFPKENDGLEFEYQLDTKTEINLYVEGDPSYSSKSLSVQKQKLQVEFLEKSIQNIKDMLWALKYTIDLCKFFEGIT